MQDTNDPAGAPPYAPAPTRKDGGHPVIATIVGVVVILLSLGGSDSAIVASGPDAQAEQMGRFVGRAMGGAAIVWLIAFAITIRKASTGWKVGSMVAFGVVSTLVALVKMGGGGGMSEATAKREMTDIARQVLDASKNGKDAKDIRIKGDGGPMSRMTAAWMNPMLADAAAYDRELQAAGFEQVVDFEGLSTKSEVLNKCPGLDRLAGRADQYRDGFANHLGAAHAVGEQAVRAGEMNAADLKGFEKGVAEGRRKIERQWELNRLMAIEAAAMCRVLARRNWEKPADMVLFRTDADLAEFNVHMDRLKAHGAEAERIRAGGKAAAETWAKGGTP